MPGFLLQSWWYDIVLGAMGFEALGLYFFLRRRRPRLIAPAMLFLAAGAIMIFATKALVMAGDAVLAAISFGVGFVLHVACLLSAWRASAP